LANIQQLMHALSTVIRLSDDYARSVTGELTMDRMLYAFLTATFKGVSRQHHVALHRSRPRRIDFRLGGTNPVVAEFAFRPAKGGQQLHGPQNASELRKLCRVTPTQAKLRALLLLDLRNAPLLRGALQESYSQVNSGRGRFTRHPVRVVYVHRKTQYHFVWKG
jgi:hypothetical protein